MANVRREAHQEGVGIMADEGRGNEAAWYHLGHLAAHLACCEGGQEAMTPVLQVLRSHGYDYTLRVGSHSSALDRARREGASSGTLAVMGSDSGPPNGGSGAGGEAGTLLVADIDQAASHLHGARTHDEQGGPTTGEPHSAAGESVIEPRGRLRTHYYQSATKLQQGVDAAPFKDLLKTNTAAHLLDLVQCTGRLAGTQIGTPDGHDSFLAPGTLDAARSYVGAAFFALLALFGALTGAAAARVGRVRNSMVLMRPPGHHAGPMGRMGASCGFCFINVIVAAAHFALETLGAARVVIIDFDVHHGDGTELAVLNMLGSAFPGRILFVSLHAHGRMGTRQAFYPGTGTRTRNNETVFNLPLSLPVTSSSFRKAIQEELVPRLATFRPTLALFSAGFDALEGDAGNYGYSKLHPDDFGAIVDLVAPLVLEGGKMLSILEGGYKTNGLALSGFVDAVTAHVDGLMRASQAAETAEEEEEEEEEEKRGREEVLVEE